MELVPHITLNPSFNIDMLEVSITSKGLICQLNYMKCLNQLKTDKVAHICGGALKKTHSIRLVPEWSYPFQFIFDGFAMYSN
jgi:aromatic ring-opening dioxygenase catalytic subunit (LigB family)